MGVQVRQIGVGVGAEEVSGGVRQAVQIVGGIRGRRLHRGAATTEADAGNLERARRFLDEEGRRIVAIGGSSEECEAWADLGAITVNGGGDLGALRQTIQKVAAR